VSSVSFALLFLGARRGFRTWQQWSAWICGVFAFRKHREYHSSKIPGVPNTKFCLSLLRKAKHARNSARRLRVDAAAAGLLVCWRHWRIIKYSVWSALQLFISTSFDLVFKLNFSSMPECHFFFKYQQKSLAARPLFHQKIPRSAKELFLCAWSWLRLLRGEKMMPPVMPTK